MTDICPFLTPQKTNTPRVHTDTGGGKKAFLALWVPCGSTRLWRKRQLCSDYAQISPGCLCWASKIFLIKEQSVESTEDFFLFPDKKEESLFLFLFVLFYLIFKPLGAACGILFSQQGSNPHLLHWKCGVLTTGPPGMSLLCFKQNLKPMTYK